MGRDSAYRTKGIRRIRLKIRDGSIKVLSDVQYVPKLKKNLNSLGSLDSKGFEVSKEGGVLKMVYGALVIMKGI